MALTRRTLLRGLPLLLALPRASQAQETWVPSAHPLNHPHTCLGWWLTTPFTGTTTWRDLLHQRSGTLTNMTPLSATSGVQRRTVRPGGWGHVAFDGTNDEVVLPDLLNSPTMVSVSVWFRTAVGNANQLLVGRVQAIAGVNPGWYLMVHDNPTGGLGWWVQSNGTTAYAGVQGTLSVADDRWHHVCATASLSAGAWSFGLWLDGRVYSASLTTAGVVGALTTVTLPRLGRTGGATLPFIGALDDVRLYNTALSTAGAQLLYADSRLGYPTLLTPGPTVASVLAVPPATVKLPSVFFGP